MKIYSIKNWGDTYENNRTRTLINMNWIPVPNSHDGDGYTDLVSRKNGAALLGAWLVILQVASRCEPRGRLVRDGGKPHDAASIARMTRLPESLIGEALVILELEIQWIESEDVAMIQQDGAGKPHPSAGKPHPTDYGMEWKGMEGKREEDSEVAPLPPPKNPDLPSVKLQSAKIGLSDIEAEKFFNYYEANGWRTGKNKMKSWTAALSGWKLRATEYANRNPATKPNPRNIGVAKCGIDYGEAARRLQAKQNLEREMAQAETQPPAASET